MDGYTNFSPDYDPAVQVGRIVREEMFEAALRLEQAIKKEIVVYDVEGYHNLSIEDRYLHSWKYLND